jgi:hypothetical protein
MMSAHVCGGTAGATCRGAIQKLEKEDDEDR